MTHNTRTDNAEVELKHVMGVIFISHHGATKQRSPDLACFRCPRSCVSGILDRAIYFINSQLQIPPSKFPASLHCFLFVLVASLLLIHRIRFCVVGHSHIGMISQDENEIATFQALVDAFLVQADEPGFHLVTWSQRVTIQHVHWRKAAKFLVSMNSLVHKIHENSCVQLLDNDVDFVQPREHALRVQELEIRHVDRQRIKKILWVNDPWVFQIECGQCAVDKTACIWDNLSAAPVANRLCALKSVAREFVDHCRIIRCSQDWEAL